MPIVLTQQLLNDAVRASSAVLAFNVITLEHAEAIVTGAQAAGRPVILQVSQNAVAYHGGRLPPIAVAAAAVADVATVAVSLHLDHVQDLALLEQAADCGFSSVMFDAGALPYADNVAQTSAAAHWAHDNELLLEAELGHVGGKDGPVGAHAPGARTDPIEAVAYVTATGVDALAVAVGSSHAMTTRSAILDVDLIGQLGAAVPVPLVLHGSSGVPDDQLRAAIGAGIRKINVGTALNVAMTAQVRRVLDESASLTDPRKYLGAGRDAAAEAVRRLLTVLS